MNDYKELVAKLRKWQTLGDAPIGNGFGVIVDKLTLKQAADAIEQLVKERDAAVEDLEAISDCTQCKHYKKHSCCEDCNDDYSNFEWRGVYENGRRRVNENINNYINHRAFSHDRLLL